MNTELWENRELGASEEHVKVVNTSADLDDRLGLQTISIRLPKQLFNELEEIAVSTSRNFNSLINTILAQYTEEKYFSG